MTDRVEKFTDEAIAILGALQADPDADYSYDHLSGGFLWTDEFPPIDSSAWTIVKHDYIYRFLLRMRRCITLGDTAIEQTPLWQQMINDAPNWPGLLLERRSGRIVKRLIAAERIANTCLDKLEAKFDSES
ncbi:MAG: hypothetical protein Aurels2KO_49440 [Aureliella sp.]